MSSASKRISLFVSRCVVFCFCGLLAPSLLEAQVPPVRISAGPTPSVRLGDECVPYSKGTVEVPILVKNDYLSDGLKVSIDYDEIFLGYAFYRATNTAWRIERVLPYGQRHITIFLKRNNKTPPANPEVEQPEVPAFYAVFYLKNGLAPDEHPFRVYSPLSLGAQSTDGGVDSFFFSVMAGQEQYRPIRTRVTDGSVTIFYRDGVEVGGGSLTNTEQLFTLPLYLTYVENAEGEGAAKGRQVFTVGIDYDEIFLSLTGVRGVVPPLEHDEEQITTTVDGPGRASFALRLADSAPTTACHVHVADLIFTYNGFAPSSDHLVVEPHLSGDAAGDGAAGPAPQAQQNDGGEGDDVGGENAKAGAGGSGPGAEPGVVQFLPPRFVRGNVDSSSSSAGIYSPRGDSRDVFLILASIFIGEADLPCADAADVNDNGKVELSDAVLLLNHLFRGGPPPVGPYPNAGEDRGDEDDLGCDKPLPYFEPTGERPAQ